MESDELNRMAREITLGVAKEDSRVTMTAEASKAWDSLAIEIAEIKAEGWIVDCPFD